MSAFFFGKAGRQLYGFYHAPLGTANGAVVICPAWGSEYQYAHRALRVLALRLAEGGMHVLRMDYSGTGDSWGDTTDADVEQWSRDVGIGIDELRAMSDASRVDVVGLRVGGLIAAVAAASRSDVRRVVLWDPIHDGAAWVREKGPSIPPKADAVTTEFGHRLVTPALVRQFESIAPSSYPARIAEGVLLLQTIPGEASAMDRLSHIAALEHRVIEDVSPWLEDQSIWSGLVPTKSVAALCDWLGQS